MPSQLIGLFRQLTWKDFNIMNGFRAQTNAWAGIRSGSRGLHVETPNIIRAEPVFGTTPRRWRLVDDITVRVVLPPGACNVDPSTFAMRPGSHSFNQQQAQDDVLHHEQGHYDLTALLARDFFVEVMLLKQYTFADPMDVSAAVREIESKTVDRDGMINLLYDQDIDAEAKAGKLRGPQQQRWDGYINAAFHNERYSQTSSIDGKMHKARLRTVLQVAGKNV